MQIHELNNYTGDLDSGAYLAVDNGSDTGKVSTTEFFADTNAAVSQLDTSLNARIDNIIAGGAAPSESEIVDARRGADGVDYASLGTAIRTQFTDLKSDLSTLTSNLLTLKQTATIKNVQFKDNGADGASLIGTANSNGGKNIKLIEDLTLPVGTYYFCVFANVEIPQFMIQSSGTILTTAEYPNAYYTFSLDDEKSIYIGVNVSNGINYDIHNLYLYLSAEKPIQVPRISAVDSLLRAKTKFIESIKESSLFSLKEYFPFTVGSYNSATDKINYATRYRLISADKYFSREPIRIYMPTGYRFAVVYYEDGNQIDTGWLYDEYIIPANKTFIIQLAKYPDVTTEKIYDVQNSDLYRALTFESYTDFFENGTVSVDTISDVNMWSQGACKVGNLLLGFNASADDHSTNGTAYRYEINDGLSEINRIYHNLGHCASADYRESLDTGLVSSGTYTQGSPESIFLIKNMRNKVENGTNLIIPNNDIIEIDLDALEGVSCGACFGESNQVAYIIKVESAIQFDTQIKKYIYKAILGQGDNDLSGAVDGYGTFISDCPTNEYNGTLKIVDKHILNVYGELQGLKYRNGFLYMSMDTRHFDGQKTPYFAKIDVNNEIVKYFKIPFYNVQTGSEEPAEAEGFIFDGVTGYISVIGSNINRLYKFNSLF